MAVAMTGFAQRASVSNDVKNASATAKRPAAARQIDGSAAQGIQFSMPQNMVSTSRSLDDFDEYQTFSRTVPSATVSLCGPTEAHLSLPLGTTLVKPASRTVVPVTTSTLPTKAWAMNLKYVKNP